MGTGEKAILNREGEEVAGNAAVGGEEGAVHMGREEPHRPGQVLQHGDGQIGVGGKDRRKAGAVHAYQLAPRYRHGGGDPGLLVEEGRLSDQTARAVEGEGALVSLVRADKDLYRPRQDIVKLLRLGALEVDELSGRTDLYALALGQRTPGIHIGFPLSVAI